MVISIKTARMLSGVQILAKLSKPGITTTEASEVRVLKPIIGVKIRRAKFV
jgi:hypothetical protein